MTAVLVISKAVRCPVKACEDLGGNQGDKTGKYQLPEGAQSQSLGAHVPIVWSKLYPTSWMGLTRVGILLKLNSDKPNYLKPNGKQIPPIKPTPVGKNTQFSTARNRWFAAAVILCADD